MANFVECSRKGDDRIVINLDRVLYIQQRRKLTRLHFDDHHSISVRETPIEIIPKNAIPREGTAHSNGLRYHTTSLAEVVRESGVAPIKFGALAAARFS